MKGMREKVRQKGAPEARSDWHAMTVPDALQTLAAKRAGLTAESVQQRRHRWGPNTLPRKPPATVLRIALRQFTSPLIYVLAAAAFASAFLGDYKDAAFITAVLLINGLIGTIQETRAEHASQALQQLLRIRATVRRDGHVVEIDAEELVPGDIVFLESGNRVPGVCVPT